MLYDELKSAVKEIAEDFEWVRSKDGLIIMEIEDWIENARLRLGKEYPDALIYIGRSFVNPKELIIGGSSMIMMSKSYLKTISITKIHQFLFILRLLFKIEIQE